GEDVAKSQRMVERHGFVDAVMHHAYGLIGKSQNPQNLRQHEASRYPLVELEAQEMLRAARRRRTSKHALEMTTRLSRIAREVQREPEHAVAHRRIHGIIRPLRQSVESSRESKRVDHCAVVEVEDPKSPERAHAIVVVVQRVRDLEGLGHCSGSLWR